MEKSSRILLFVIFLVYTSQIAFGRDRILIISGYNENFEYGLRQIGGMEKGLSLGGVPISSLSYKSFYIDTLTTYVTDKDVDYITEYAINLIQTWKPKVMLIAGQKAFEKIAIGYQQMRLKNNSMPAVPMVFCGINQDVYETNPYPGILSTSSSKGTVSGISVYEPYQQKIDLAITLKPNGTKIAFLFDATLTSRYQLGILKNLMNQSSINSYGLPIEIHQVNTFPIFKQRILDLQFNNSMIIVMNTMRLYLDDTFNKSVLPHEISEWVLSNVNLDVLGPTDFGFASNVQTSPNITCSYAGIMAANILLQNKNTDRIDKPIYTQSETYFIETTIQRSKFNFMKKLSPQAKKMLSDTNIVPNINIYDPLFFTNPFKLMIVHSFSQTYDWPIQQQQGFQDGLKNHGYPRSSYYLRTFWMDTKETYNTDDLVEYAGSVALNDVTLYRPNLFFATDDESFRLVQVPYANATLNTSSSCISVFTGLDSDPSSIPLIGNLSSPRTNMTGIVEVFNFDLLIILSRSINPTIKSITFLFDGSAAGVKLSSNVANLVKQYGDRWPKSRSFLFNTFSQLKKFFLDDAISRDPTDLIIYGAYAGYKNEDGTGVSGDQVIKWVNSRRNGTEVSPISTFAIDGGLMALGQDPTDAGSATALYAALLMNGTSVSTLPITPNVPNGLSFNRQRILFTNAKIPTNLLIGAKVYESENSNILTDLISTNSEVAVGYLTFVLFLILGLIAVCLFQFIALFWPKGSNVVSAKYRSVFYCCLIVLSILRMFQMIVELNVKPPATNLITEFVLYRLGSIFYIASMMVECLLWINIIKASFDSNFFLNFMKGYCITLFIINTIAQITSLIVFSIYANNAVALNQSKIIAYNQGLYVSRYGSIKEEIVQTNTQLRAAARSSQLITGVIGVLHALIFFIVGMVFMKTVVSSSNKSENRSKKRRYIALKIIILTTIIGICSCAALVYFIILATGTSIATQRWVSLLFDLIIFEWIPSFSLLVTYVYSARSSLSSKKTHIKLKDKEDVNDTSSSSFKSGTSHKSATQTTSVN